MKQKRWKPGTTVETETGRHLFKPVCFDLPFGGGRFCFIAKWEFKNNLTHTPVAAGFTLLYLLILMLTPFHFMVAVAMATASGLGTGIGKETAEGTCGQGFDFIDLAFWILGVAIVIIFTMYAIPIFFILGILP